MQDERMLQAAQLWANYVRAKQALLAAGFIRSFKSTEADFAEYLVAAVLDGRLPNSKSHPGYDVIAADKKVQVKSVTKALDNPNGYILTKDDRKDGKETTHYAFVFFNELIPDAVFLVEEAFVRNFGKTQIKRPDLEAANCKMAIDLSVFNSAASKGRV